MRLRFAPSPTGYLHVGGARTALYNWLLARRTGGIFLLRIEDTDRARSQDAHTQAILSGLTWLGLDWDEGPVFQSDGALRHRADAERLLAAGLAYRDFTTPESLRAEADARGLEEVTPLAREHAAKVGRDEAERRATAGEPHAIRFLIPEGTTSWNDRVRGEVSFENAAIEDLVILRSDGSPTYNMAVVSDDAEARITHVIRGEDHISNTPKQILLYRALGKPVPEFGHLPLIVGADGKRLSKRHGATAVGEYESQGILPTAMFNFLALLGWNPGDDREVMDAAELIQAFSIERVQKKAAVFDTEKLQWLNGQYLARTPADDVARLVLPQLALQGVDPAQAQERWGWFVRLVGLLKMRARTVTEIALQSRGYFADLPELDGDAVAKHWAKNPAEVSTQLESVLETLSSVEWQESALEGALRALAERMGLGAGKLIHPLRVALTGQAASPGIFEVLVLLGPEASRRRVSRALAELQQLSTAGWVTKENTLS
jgi:glutamyl-tRNA synthetase